VTGHILLVEDEEAIAESIAYALRGEGFEVEPVSDGESALDRAAVGDYELIILDVMLPGLSGLEVCRRLRAGANATPILILTARTAEVDRVVGLEAGADDYVVKPFSMPELVARVRAMLRRRELDRAESSNGVRIVAGLELDTSRHSVTVEGRKIELTNSEFRLLRTLAERPGHVYSRRELMQRLWDSSYVGDERAADVHVANLRRKIEADPQNPVRIVTVRGAGYALAEV
jgi:two-component system response regulator RegX3